MPPSYKKIKRPERQRLIAVIAALVTVLTAWLAFSPYGAVRYYRVHREMRSVQADNQRISKENKELAKEIYRLKSDRAYQEAVARQNFGMIKKNEMVFDFSGEKKKGKEKEEE